mmetsp:Transcript_24290/g.33962  ORF Transcript_24290/g.33962 Transcript_24290/m.33962 type:complete len:137 (+) Transcript_24290:203-613(+)
MGDQGGDPPIPKFFIEGLSAIWEYGWLVLFGIAMAIFGYQNWKASQYKVVGRDEELDSQLRLARERQVQRLTEEAKTNPAKKKKGNEERAKKRRKDKRRFDPDAAWVQGENLDSTTSRFRPDVRSRHGRFGGGGGG